MAQKNVERGTQYKTKKVRQHEKNYKIKINYWKNSTRH